MYSEIKKYMNILKKKWPPNIVMNLQYDFNNM